MVKIQQPVTGWPLRAVGRQGNRWFSYAALTRADKKIDSFCCTVSRFSNLGRANPLLYATRISQRANRPQQRSFGMVV